MSHRRATSLPRAPGDIVRRGGIVVSIARGRNRWGGSSWSRIACVWQHVRSTPYFTVHTRQTRVSTAAGCSAARAGCTPPLGYVIYRPVKGSVKIFATTAHKAAARFRPVSCVCSLSSGAPLREERERERAIAMTPLAHDALASLTAKSRARNSLALIYSRDEGTKCVVYNVCVCVSGDTLARI